MNPLNEINLQSYLPASWINKPENLHACTSLRAGGVSVGDYSEFNLASHVGDELSAVYANRGKLLEDLQLPAEPVWLDQVHSNKVICLDEVENNKAENRPLVPRADASMTSSRAVVCVVLTADCLPVFFCNKNATEVAVAHAGWRGLYAGIISNTIKAMSSPAEDIMVSLGPAIGPRSFEVGEEVFHAFVDKDEINEQAFVASSQTGSATAHYLCDLYQLASYECRSLGVSQIAGGDHCTYRDSYRFYSYRKQHNTGRMASLIWLE